ncbi:CHL1 [Sanghuangporus vaninii]
MDDVKLSVPENFRAFPFERPYPIQKDFMRHVYSAIENRKLAIAESPTGTGKTLSLLTSSLTWLRDERQRSKRITLESLRDSLHSTDDPEWVIMQTLERLKNEIETEELDLQQYLADLRAKEESSRREHARVTKRPRMCSPRGRKHNDSDDESLLPDSESSDSQEDLTPPLSNDRTKGLLPSGTKIFFASRTHSQLSQVIHELLALKPIPGVPDDLEEDGTDPRHLASRPPRFPRSVSLASRNHLCINEQLRTRTIDLDEGCRQLLSGRRGERCPYLPPLGEEHRLNDLRDRILASPKDIEDLVITGKDMKLCPYFGSRLAIASAELVTLPYNLLLHEKSRKALDINLQDQIVIIDEAHNLIDALLQLHTIELSVSMLQAAIEQLTAYLSRFRTRLNSTNSVQLKRLMLFLLALHQFVESRSATCNSVTSVSEFVESLGNKVNGINLHELQSYLTTSKIARKVSRYSEKRAFSDSDKEDNGDVRGASPLPLHTVEAFISKLTNHIEDGVITVAENRLVSRGKTIKYQHLNPATYFECIARSARSVILAGGTMSPVSDMALQLFPNIAREQLTVFSCGHVIPRANLLCLVLGTGPRGKDLEFRFKDREDRSLIDDLGQCLFNLASVCPNGAVVFFPSYAFLDKVRRDWNTNGLLSRIQQKKQLFYEPHANAEVDDTLQQYALACNETSRTSRGAMLFAVVGAKLSEGLNFADELARAVVLVGIPYPNIASPELKERMNYMRKHKQTTSDKEVDPGNELYENLAMRAVNQSIGRAIRHQNDWSALILVDKRYSSQKVQAKLPGWICQDIAVPQSFGQAMKSLGEFYRSKRL